MTRLAHVLAAAVAVLSSASDVPLEVGAPLHLDCGVRGHPRHCFWETEDGRVFQVEDVHAGRHVGFRAPHDLTHNQCGIVVEQGGAGDAGAWTCRVFLQGEALSTVRNVVSQNSKACQAPFVAVGTGCFFFSSEDVTASWDDARVYCNALSAQSDLAVVNDCYLMQLIWNYIVVNYGQSDHWVGGTDEHQEGVWLWVDGTHVTMGTPFWAPGEPNSSNGTENCLEMRSKPGGYFNDEKCDSKFHFVCQDGSSEAV